MPLPEGDCAQHRRHPCHPTASCHRIVYRKTRSLSPLSMPAPKRRRDSAVTDTSLRRDVHSTSDFLSWGFKDLPLLTYDHCVLSRTHRSEPSTNHCQMAGTFRPCRSSRLRRLAPQCPLQVCCALQPIMGFAWFPSSLRHSPRRCAQHSRECRPKRRGAPQRVLEFTNQLAHLAM
jgi:hypothetical protein